MSGRGRPTWVEIDHAALRHNLMCIGRRVGPDVRTIGVIKANAYGHGAIQVANSLLTAGVSKLAVATVAEGLELRRAGIDAPILVFAGRYQVAAGQVWEAGLEPVVFDHDVLDSLESARPDGALPLSVHVHLDSGMGRLGCAPGDFDSLLARIRASDAFELVALMTHLACADAASRDHTEQQLRVFDKWTKNWEGYERHAANSSAVAAYPAAHYDWIRPGLALYGVEPVKERKLGLQPVMRWLTHIEHCRRIGRGQSVGYGARWRAARESHIGILPVGYADGYPWSAEGRAEVLISGRRFPVIGAISMDLTAVDLTDAPEMGVGAEVVLLGGQGQDRITVEEMARWSGRLVYEVLTSVGVRVPRRHLDEAA